MYLKNFLTTTLVIKTVKIISNANLHILIQKEVLVEKSGKNKNQIFSPRDISHAIGWKKRKKTVQIHSRLWNQFMKKKSSEKIFQKGLIQSNVCQARKIIQKIQLIETQYDQKVFGSKDSEKGEKIKANIKLKTIKKISTDFQYFIIF